MVHTKAAGMAGTEVACVHVLPPSDVLRKVPVRCGAEPAPAPPCVGPPLTLTTQCSASAHANLPTEALGIPCLLYTSRCV